jgi:hypothetical protein
VVTYLYNVGQMFCQASVAIGFGEVQVLVHGSQIRRRWPGCQRSRWRGPGFVLTAIAICYGVIAGLLTVAASL